jgi:hypothetical protein
VVLAYFCRESLAGLINHSSDKSHARLALAVSGRVYSSNDRSGLLQTLRDTDILVVETEIAATEAAEISMVQQESRLEAWPCSIL